MMRRTVMDANEVKRRHEIGDVVGQYIALTWKGDKGTGCCPFHDDSHPSLTVYRRTQTFICFACGAKGDVITFVRQKERCSFTQALEKLGGVNSSHKARQQPAPVQEKPEAGKPPVSVPPARDHSPFLKMLMPVSAGHPELSPVWLEFEVGQSPVQVPVTWQAQRNRMVFPIRNENGILAGFTARSLDDASPKYIHTASADGFHTGHVLYGLYKGKEDILRTGTVYLTEGVKDVLAMHAAGYRNTVALLGLNLSGRQLELIRIHAHRVILLPDGDERGREGMRKMTATLEASGMQVSMILLPEGEDPDSLFRRKGKEGFAQWMAYASTVCPPEETLLMQAVLHCHGLLTTCGDMVIPAERLIYHCLAAEGLLPLHPFHSEWLERIATANQSGPPLLPEFFPRCEPPSTIEPLRWLSYCLEAYKEVRLAEEINRLNTLLDDTSDPYRTSRLFQLMYRHGQWFTLPNSDYPFGVG